MTGPTAQPDLALIQQRERQFLLGGIVLMVLLSWWYLVDMALIMADMGDMQSMQEMSMPAMHSGSMDMADMPNMDMAQMNMPMSEMTMDMPGMTMNASWQLRDFIMLFVMWAVMMVAMMLPSAAPMLLAFITVNRRRHESRAVPAYLFLLGYLLVWSGYSIGATALQWGFQQQHWLDMNMTLKANWLTGLILIAAGLFQFSGLKQRCLSFCRSPLNFLMAHWREGRKGALLMGLQHGSFCVGCCWVLMLVLFVTGVMNLLAVLLLALFVLLEKWITDERWKRLLVSASGAGLIITGAGYLLVGLEMLV